MCAKDLDTRIWNFEHMHLIYVRYTMVTLLVYITMPCSLKLVYRAWWLTITL